MESSTEKDPSNSGLEKTKNASIDAIKKEKAKLRKDIKELKALNFQMECCLGISKFGNIEHLLKSSEPPASSSSLKKIPDVETEYTDELFQLAGIRCAKFTATQYIFSFISSGNFKSNDCNYSIEINFDSNEPKVGKRIMPMSVDMNSVLLETPLRTPVDLKPFLTNCRHHINCYVNRLKQYDELQLIFEGSSGCSLDSNLGHTAIILRFFNVQIAESHVSYNVILYLIYKSERVRPHKIVVDTPNAKELSDDVKSKLKTYYKHFKRFELKNAFEETCKETDGPVKWIREQKGENLDLNDSSLSGSEEGWEPSRKKTARRGSKRKMKETSLQSQGSPNREERPDDLDVEETVAPGSSLVNSIDQGSKSPPKARVEREPAKKKKKKKKTQKVASTETEAAPEVKKKPQVAETRNTSLKPSQNTSKTNLRQSTLNVRFKKPEETGRRESNAKISTVEQIPSINSSNLPQQSITHANTSKNFEFGTSTPVNNMNSIRKKFVPLMSPIKPKRDVITKKKSSTKKLG